MLPISFKKFIPKIFHKDPKSDILGNKIDGDLVIWRKDVLDILRLNRADEIESRFLPELNILLNAGFKDYDDDRQKRKKIFNAVQGHRFRGTFNLDVKQRLDLITEKSSRILDDTDVEIFGQDDWIMLTDGGAADFQVGTKYWGAMGVDGIDDDLGIALSGGDEVWVKVNVYIDLHEGFDTAILSQEIIDKCVLELADVAPAYFFVFLGYVDSSDNFQEYAKIG